MGGVTVLDSWFGACFVLLTLSAFTLAANADVQSRDYGFNQKLCAFTLDQTDDQYAISDALSNTMLFQKHPKSENFRLGEGYFEYGRLRDGKVQRHFKYFFDSDTQQWKETSGASPHGAKVVFPKLGLEYINKQLVDLSSSPDKIETELSCAFQAKTCSARIHTPKMSIKWHLHYNNELNEVENIQLNHLFKSLAADVEKALAAKLAVLDSKKMAFKCRSLEKFANQRFDFGKKFSPDEFLINGSVTMPQKQNSDSAPIKIATGQTWKAMKNDQRAPEKGFSKILAMTNGTPINSIKTSHARHKDLKNYTSNRALQLLDHHRKVSLEIVRAERYFRDRFHGTLIGEGAKKHSLHRIKITRPGIQHWEINPVDFLDSEEDGLYIYRTGSNASPYRILKCDVVRSSGNQLDCLVVLDRKNWRFVAAFGPSIEATWSRTARQIERQFKSR